MGCTCCAIYSNLNLQNAHIKYNLQAIITGVALIPRMVTRFLLVGSLSVLDLEAFDAVVEVSTYLPLVSVCVLALYT